MKIRLYLYGMLMISVFIQSALVKNIWFPDIMILIVIFAGIFLGIFDGVVIGLAAGFLRGCFSVNTMLINVLAFAFVGIISSILGKKFYRQNPAAQIFITAMALLTVMTAQVFYLNFLYSNDISLQSIFYNSWRHLAVTVFVSPVLFIFLKEFLRVEE